MKHIVFISLLFAFASCGEKKTTEQTETVAETNVVTLTDAQMKYAMIETGQLQQQQISQVLKVNGKIDVPPQSMASVTVPLGGYVKHTRMMPGMAVQKNQVIATLEDNQYIQLQQDYLTAKAQYTSLESEYNRQKELNQSKASSDKVFEQARSAYQTQRILIRSLEEKLRLININPATLTEGRISKSINIYAPISGFVSKANVNNGQYVMPGEILFEILNPENLHLSLKIFEKDLVRIFIGQPVVAYTNNDPSKKYAGKITLVNKDISGDGATQVLCSFNSYNKALLPGMYMNAEIELKNEPSNTLNEDAVVHFESKNYVFIQTGKNQFEMTEVSTGESGNGHIAILSPAGFNGRPVVTRGAYTLLMSLKNKEEE
jgi:cobalt-zinc-cadmium efflux system membrane fusion protein